MKCPRCQNYIVPEFYCTNCGHVPPRTQDPVPRNVTELEIPFEPHPTVRHHAKPLADRCWWFSRASARGYVGVAGSLKNTKSRSFRSRLSSAFDLKSSRL